VALTKKQIEEAKARLHGENVRKATRNKSSVSTWLLRSCVLFLSYCAFGYAYNTYQIKKGDSFATLNFTDPVGIIQDILNKPSKSQQLVVDLPLPEKKANSNPQDENIYVSPTGKIYYDWSTEESKLAFVIDVVREILAPEYIAEIKEFQYEQLHGTCNIKFQDAPGRKLVQGLFFDHEVAQLEQWHESEFEKLVACLQEEQAFNINQLNNYFIKLFDNKTAGAEKVAKERHRKATFYNEKITAALDSVNNEINNTVTETYNRNIKDWKQFINNKIMPALEEGRREERYHAQLVAKRKAAEYEANRPGGYNNPICTNCNQGSELEQFARSVNKAANKYIKQPQRQRAAQEARNISNYVQIKNYERASKVRDRLYADESYQRGKKFHLKSEEHRPISLKPNSSTPPIKEFKEDRTSCPLAAHEYQEKTACWCLKTGTRCKTVLK